MIFLSINAVFPYISGITGGYSSEIIAKTVSKLEAKVPKYDISVLGKASWYGKPFHGRLTANGEIYDMHTLTAAHKTLPFDSLVKITNLINGESVIVRINDRGPYIQGRQIDLSYAAAQQINMVGTGVTPIKMEVMLAKSKFDYQKRFSLLKDIAF